MKTRKIVTLLIAVVAVANTMLAQTILTETFGTSEVPVTFYTGGTSVPSVEYTESPQVPPAGYVSTVFSTSPDACLLFKSTGTIARANMTAPLPTSPAGLVSVLTDNTKLVTWTVNMKSSRLSTNSFSTITGFPEFKYFNATILCASNSTVIGEPGVGNGTDGYAVIVQKSSADGTRASIGLVKFHNGIGVLASEGSVLTRLIESPLLVNPNLLAAPILALSATNPNNLSIKVTYNPNLDIWELFYREDPGTAFADPSSGAYTKAGTSVADAFSTPMTHFGFAAGLQTSTSAGNIYQFDNFKIALSYIEPYITPAPTASAQTFCGTATVANLVATGTNLKWYANTTGGTAMTSSEALTTQTYYVSQTVYNVESARTAVEVTVTTPSATSTIRIVPATTAIPSVTIGTQTWTSKNLDVSTYSDGTPIQQVTDATEWAKLTTGAWCYYNNDPANGAIYGKLYNWFAVTGIHDNDPNTPNKILAPIGWHVPTDGEWTTLTTSLGGESTAGGKMKETGTAHWQSPNTEATNSSGFSVLPGGYRFFNNSTFGYIGNFSAYWCNSEVSATEAWMKDFMYDNGKSLRGLNNKSYGFSVRLIKD